MKKTLTIILILAAFTSHSVKAADEDMLRQATQACVFGAAVLGVSSAVVLYPAMVVGSSGVPATSLIIGNTLFGCGISALGAAAAGVYGQLYDQMFPPQGTAAKETAAPEETAAPVESDSQVLPNTEDRSEIETVPPSLQSAPTK
ncbi:hypothetical protein TI05_06180 [Achromatium sp. WMS3]|nr:hypothetical protein TI05_06180 [Achromatium sp. WMS3]